MLLAIFHGSYSHLLSKGYVKPLRAREARHGRYARYLYLLIRKELAGTFYPLFHKVSHRAYAELVPESTRKVALAQIHVGSGTCHGNTSVVVGIYIFLGDEHELLRLAEEAGIDTSDLEPES